MAAVLLTLEPCIIRNANTVKSDGVLTALSVILSTARPVLIVGDTTAMGSSSAGDDAIKCDTYGTGTDRRTSACPVHVLVLCVCSRFGLLTRSGRDLRRFGVGSDAKRRIVL